MFSTMIQQATLGSYLDLPESERISRRSAKKKTPNKGLTANESRKANTNKRYMKEIGESTLTTGQIAEKMGINLSAVNRRVKILKGLGMLKCISTRQGKTNTAHLWSKA